MTKKQRAQVGCDAISTDGGPPCGAAFRPQTAGDALHREYRCEHGHVRSEQYLALHQVGPYTPERPEEYEPRDHVPGFRWDAREQCYVRIKSQEQIDREVADDMRRWYAKGRP